MNLIDGREKCGEETLQFVILIRPHPDPKMDACGVANGRGSPAFTDDDVEADRITSNNIIL